MQGSPIELYSCIGHSLYTRVSLHTGIWILVYRRPLTRLVGRAGVLGAASRDAQRLEGAVLQAAGIQGSPLPNNN